MTETRSQKQESGSKQSGGSQQSGGSNPLQTDRSNTTIQDGVVSQIAGIAAGEVEGVRMGGGGAASQAVSGLLGNIPGMSGGQSKSSGISVEVGQEQALDLTCSVEYGKSIPQLSEAVRRNVINRVENLVGLKVTEVNIAVSNIYFPQEEEQQKQEIEEKRQERQQNKQEQQQDQRVQ